MSDVESDQSYESDHESYDMDPMEMIMHHFAHMGFEERHDAVREMMPALFAREIYRRSHQETQQEDSEEEKESVPSETDAEIEPEIAEAIKNQDKARSLCRFFVLKQQCRYGDACCYSHDLPEGGFEEAKKQVPCRFYLQGNCRYGNKCKLRHAAEDLEEKDDVTAPLTCGICFEDIVRSGKRFGLLSCPHCFCIDCLRTWRKTDTTGLDNARSCPACRKRSDFIVPSKKFCLGEEKKQVIASYKKHLAESPCKYFTGELGSCPFGRDCFYAHVVNGQDTKPNDRKMRRRHHHVGIPEGLIDPFLFFLDLGGWEYESLME